MKKQKSLKSSKALKSLKSLFLGKFAGAIAGASLLLNACEPVREEYVSPGAVDARGTWYDHGQVGRGWYGPEKTWGFEWYYFEQYGTNIEGRWEFEFYDQNDPYEELTEVNGSVNGNEIHLNIFNPDGSLWSIVDADISGNSLDGKELWLKRNWFLPFYLERTNHEIKRQATPWDPEGSDKGNP